MRVLYLTNVYPKVSHTFIRREIEGVEANGIKVERVSIRRSDEELCDALDRLEATRTHVLLDAGICGLCVALARAFVRSPLGLARALVTSMRMGVGSDRGTIRHLGYLAEACVLDLRYHGAIDHVHVHFATNPTTVALLWRIIGGPSFSFTAHGTLDFDTPRAISLTEKIAAANFVVAVSRYGRGQLMRWSPESCWDKIHVVRCGVDQDFLGAEGVPVPCDARVVCVARLSADKGIAVLLHAVQRVVNTGRRIELVIVGDGPERLPLMRLASDLGVTEAVAFRGALDGDGVRSEISAARALVLPSFAEGLPVVLMEALALRRPVVATATNGIPELVETGVTGWLVSIGDKSALADALVEVLEAQPEALWALAEKGRERVAQLHDAMVESSRLAILFQTLPLERSSVTSHTGPG
jgi:colanic acid/amylovoran biosynthesis glycosyltransferase